MRARSTVSSDVSGVSSAQFALLVFALRRLEAMLGDGDSLSVLSLSAANYRRAGLPSDPLISGHESLAQILR
jgi:hypothetical protein